MDSMTEPGGWLELVLNIEAGKLQFEDDGL